MKRTLKHLAVAVAVVVGLIAQNAQASILGGLLNFGQLNVVRDDSVGVLNDKQRSLLDPQPGDILQGIFKINDVDNNPVQGVSIWGIYSLEVTSVNGPLVTLGVPTVGSGNHITDIMSNLGLATPGTARSGSTADATLVVVETNSVVSLPNFSGGTFDATLAGTIDAAWSASMLLGLVNSDNYHEVLLVPALNMAGFSLSYSVIADVFAPGISYDDTEGLVRPSTGLPGVGEFTTTNVASIGLSPPTDPTLNNWQFSDKADFQILPTPEPASIAVWTGLAAGIGLVARRRFTKA